MRYIGGKSALLNDIGNVIGQLIPDGGKVIDLFSGSGAVTEYLKQQRYDVICNDQLYFSFVLLRGMSQLDRAPEFAELGIKDPLGFLNQLELKDTGKDIGQCFIYQNYCPHDECTRMYFTPENGLKIDLIRLTIEDWKEGGLITEDEYFYLLAALISAVPYVSNVAGVYAAFLKKWDPRALKPLEMKSPVLISSGAAVESYNEKCNDLLKKVSADVLYSDSPYNSREYLPNYHILETVARYDYPEIKGVTGMRDYVSQKSDFCSKARVHTAFETMIENADIRYVVISYNNEGLISTEELSGICREFAVPGTFNLLEIPYQRYKSRIPNNKEGLKEQIYWFKKS